RRQGGYGQGAVGSVRYVTGGGAWGKTSRVGFRLAYRTRYQQRRGPSAAGAPKRPWPTARAFARAVLAHAAFARADFPCAQGAPDEPSTGPPDLLHPAHRALLRRPRPDHRRGPHLGGRLPQSLAARPDRALDA